LVLSGPKVKTKVVARGFPITKKNRTDQRNWKKREQGELEDFPGKCECEGGVKIKMATKSKKRKVKRENKETQGHWEKTIETKPCKQQKRDGW